MCGGLCILPLLPASPPDEHNLLQAPSACELFPHNPQSQLVRWKHITLQEVQVDSLPTGVFAVPRNDSWIHSRLLSLQVWPSSTSRSAPTDSSWLLSKSNKVLMKDYCNMPSVSCNWPHTVRLHSLVCVGTDYPSTPPSLAVMVESNGQRETHNIQTKVTE